MIPAEFARLPVAIEPLAIFLFIAHRAGSYAAAAIALAVFSISLAIAWPVHGRLIDRRGLRPVVGGLAAAHTAALVVFVAAAHSQVWVTVAAVAPLAGTLAPIGSTIRAAWARLVERGPLLDRANALEAVLVEISFMIGPALAGLLANVLGALITTLLAGALMVVGSVGYVSAPALARRAPENSPIRTASRRPWQMPGVPAILVAVGLGAAAFAVLEVAVPATVSAHGMSPGTGVALLSLPPAASAIGGLVHGARQHSRAPAQRYLVLLAAMCACMAPLVVPSPVGVLAACLFLAGLPLAAVSSEEFGLLGELVPAAVINEIFALAATMMALGSAVGNLAAGTVVTSAGPTWARVLAPGSALLAFGTIWVVRDTLRAVGQHGASQAGREVG